MPQNFQDAVILTRALGLRYVWIDSLCIIQDSMEDWEYEGSQMDKVYKNAWVTVAATSASTSEDGFLSYPLRSRMLELQLEPKTGCEEGNPPKTPQANYRSIFVRYMENLDFSRFQSDVEMTTWSSRGWTLQERHLAKRVLHFSRSQIFFECKDSYKSECGQNIEIMPFFFVPHSVHSPPSEASSTSSGNDSDTEPETALSLTESLPEEEERKLLISRLYTWWFQVLYDYGRRQLTYSSDKLVAISGIASQLADTAQSLGVPTKDRIYLCGLWKGCLADCLLWVPGEVFLPAKAEGYRAPTWSWAAWDGEIVTTSRSLRSWDHYPSEPYFEYVSHNVELTSENPYGCVRSASLVLRGKLRSISMAAPDDRTQRYPRLALNMHLQNTDGLLGYAVVDCVDYAETALTATNLYAFAVVRQQPGVRTRPSDSYQSGLVLQSTVSEHEFKRIGAFVLLEIHLDTFEAVETKEFTLV